MHGPDGNWALEIGLVSLTPAESARERVCCILIGPTKIVTFERKLLGNRSLFFFSFFEECAKIMGLPY